MQTGIDFEDARRALGWITEYEEREVAREYHYRWEDWLALSMAERASCVAHSRLRHAVETHANDAVQADAEMRQRRAARRRGR